MLSNDRKLRADLIFASTMLAAGLVLCGFSVVTTTRTNVHLAQATPPSQGSPSTTTNDKPAESKPGGTRPTTPAPEPARPDAQAQKEGAKAALPPAPPEKIAPPIEKK
ncbi:MAG: hypothetical protein WBG16_00760 [Bradyrhizobium sp.]|uniref:hypothetical protein n=1 Tax=Bradyrhizobium sp. TaxID=376 RepID=UPI003C789BDB